MAFTYTRWKILVREIHPQVQFTQEDGSCKTYGEFGDWTAHTGPDMQADVVGVFTTIGHCSVLIGNEFVDYATE
jgi:hypothetical protein